MKRVIISVTAKDIAKCRGLGNTPSTCPIAQSFKRRGVTAYVGTRLVGVGTEGTEYISLPPAARVFVQRADTSYNTCVEPFSFAIKVPDDIAVVLQRKRSHRALQRHLEA